MPHRHPRGKVKEGLDVQIGSEVGCLWTVALWMGFLARGQKEPSQGMTTGRMGVLETVLGCWHFWHPNFQMEALSLSGEWVVFFLSYQLGNSRGGIQIRLFPSRGSIQNPYPLTSQMLLFLRMREWVGGSEEEGERES